MRSPSDIIFHLTQNWDNWVPLQSDIDWTRQHLERISDGGHWAHSQGMFRVDKKNKMLVHLVGPKGEIFQKVRKVLPLIGWTMQDQASN